MNIEHKYLKLTNSKLDFSVIGDINKLRNECKSNNNDEYFYLSNLLLIRVYLNEKHFDDSLNLAIRTYNEIDKDAYPKVYLSLIEYIIYIYIEKQNFSSAYLYANEKRHLLDETNKDAVNRWYLEMAYIHESLQEGEKAMTLLKAILANEPDFQTKGVVLGNICRLLISNQMYEESKVYLEECMKIAFQQKDKAGIRYCEYLNALLYEGEKKYKFAYKIYADLFKGKVELTNEYLSYLNDFLKLLLKMENYAEAKKLCIRFIDSVSSSVDNSDKKKFYEYYLLSIVYSTSSEVQPEIKSLVNTIALLEKDLKIKKDRLSKEIKDDELFHEVNNKEKDLIKKFDKVINDISLVSLDYSERDYLFNFAKKLETIVPFNEAMFAVFDRKKLDFLPEFYSDFNHISTYNYKSQRLYHREISYSDLNDTIIEMIVKGEREIFINFEETAIDIKEIVSQKPYIETKTKYLCAFALEIDSELFACAIFTSNSFDITQKSARTSLKLASKIIQNNLLNIFATESLKYQKTIYDIASSSLEQGMFYYDFKNEKIILTEQFESFLNIDEKEMSISTYNKLISENIDKTRKSFIEKSSEYRIEYHLNLNEEILVVEKGVPYYSNGNLLFYIVTVNKFRPSMILEKKALVDRILTIDDMNDDNYKYYYGLAITSLEQCNVSNRDFIVKSVYKQIKEQCSETYLIRDDLIVARSNEKLTDLKNIIKSINKGLVYNKQVLPVNVEFSLIKYLEDLSVIDDIVNYFQFIFDNQIFSSKFDSNSFSIYLKQKEVNYCLEQALEEGFESLDLPLTGSDFSGKHVMYNVKGLPVGDSCQYASIPTKVNFEKALFKKIDFSNGEKYVIKLDPFTLEALINDDYFNNRRFDNLIICLDRYVNNIDVIIKWLAQIGIKFFVSNSVFNNIKTESIYLGYIVGIADNSFEDSQLQLYQSLSLYIFSDTKIDYPKLISKSN